MPISINTWSTAVALGVVQDLRRVPTAYRDRYFSGQPFYSNAEKIIWDEAIGDRRLANFQLPTVAADYTQSKGAVASEVIPSYIRELDPVHPGMAKNRLPGEPLMGNLSPADRMNALKLRVSQNQLTRIRNREEVMCVEALLKGRVTCTSPKYPTQVVNYQRSNALTVALAGASRWDQAGSNPINDINTLEQLLLNTSGSPLIDLVFNGPAWTLFENHIAVKDYLKFINGSNQAPDVAFDNPNTIGLNFKGRIKSINIFLYIGSYEDSAGALQPIMPTTATVNAIGMPETFMGYGAIMNMHSLMATDYFPHNFVEENPSREVLSMESSPMPIVARTNATAEMTVV